MGLINGVVICNGTNPPRRRKGDKRLNPLAPEFVPKNLESTPPSSGETAFAVPHHPPHLGPCPYQAQGRQELYQPQGFQGAYQGHHRQASVASYQGGYVAYQPPAAAYGYEHHMSFGRNITQEVMAMLNGPSPPRSSTYTYQAPVYPTIAGWQTT